MADVHGARPQPPVEEALAVHGGTARREGTHLSPADQHAQAMMQKQCAALAAGEERISSDLATINAGGRTIIGTHEVIQQPSETLKAAGKVALGLLGVGIPFLHPRFRSSIVNSWSGPKRSQFSTFVPPEQRASAQAAVKRQYSVEGKDGRSYDLRIQSDRTNFASKEYKVNPQRFTRVRGSGLFMVDKAHSRVLVVPEGRNGEPDFSKADAYDLTDTKTGAPIKDYARLMRDSYNLVKALPEIEAGLDTAKNNKLKFLLSDANTEQYLDRQTLGLVDHFGFSQTSQMLRQRVNAFDNQIRLLEEEANRNPQQDAKLTQLKADRSAARNQLNTLHAKRDRLQNEELAARDGPDAAAALNRLNTFSQGKIAFYRSAADTERAKPDPDEAIANGHEAAYRKAVTEAKDLVDARFRNWTIGDDDIPQLEANLAARSGTLGATMIQSRNVALDLHNQGTAYHHLENYVAQLKLELKTAGSEEEKERIQEVINRADEKMTLLVRQSAGPEEMQNAVRNGYNAKLYLEMKRLEGSTTSESDQGRIVRDLSTQLGSAELFGNIEGEINEMRGRVSQQVAAVTPGDDSPGAIMWLSLQKALELPQDPTLQGTASGDVIVTSEGRYMQLLRQPIQPSRQSIYDLQKTIRDLEVEIGKQIEEQNTQIKNYKQQKQQLSASAEPQHEIEQINLRISEATKQIQKLRTDLQQQVTPMKQELSRANVTIKAMRAEARVLRRYYEAAESIRQLKNGGQHADLHKELEDKQSAAGSALGQLFHSYTTAEATDPDALRRKIIAEGSNLASWSSRADVRDELKGAIKTWKPRQFVLQPHTKTIRAFNASPSWDNKKQAFVHKTDFENPVKGIEIKMSDGYWKSVERSGGDEFAKQMAEGERDDKDAKGPKDLHIAEEPPKDRNPLSDFL